MKSQIQPVTFWQETATQFEIELVQIRSLGEEGSAIVAWNLKNDSDKVLKSGTTILSGSDYSDWGSDDSYIVSKTAEILQLTLISAAE
jgi:hypothetical protein